jgi:hypothetical protein
VTSGIAGDDEFHRLELNLHPNEASGLLTVENDALLEAHEWKFALWAVLDEGRIEDCIAIIGHRRGADIGEGWDIERLYAVPADEGVKTEDAESVARHGGWMYLFGSHFGAKGGPLQPKRGFVARFREADVGHATNDPAVALEVFRESFMLHRLINDALKAEGPDLIPLGPASYEALIEETTNVARKSARNGAASCWRKTT